MKVDIEDLIMKDGWLLLKDPSPESNDKTPSGIVIPDANKQDGDIIMGFLVKKSRGYILDKKDEYMSGDVQLEYMPIDITEGSRVYYAKAMGKKIFINGTAYTIVNEESVIMHVPIL